MRSYCFVVAAALLGGAGAAAADPPNVRTWALTRDADGRLTVARGPGGREDKYAYHPGGGLREVRRADGSTVAFEYTPAGARLRMTDTRGATDYEYDAFGFPARVTTPDGTAVRYRFDPRGLVRRVELSDKWWVTYDYDPLDRPVAVDSPLGKVTYAYTPNRKVGGKYEPLVVRRLPNGVVTTWTTDARGELARLTHERGGVLLAGWEFTRDTRGRIATARDLKAGSTRKYEYDTLGRLRSASAPGAEERYEYGPGSDLVRATRGGTTTAFTPGPFGELARAGDEARGYTPAGELDRRDAPAGRHAYRWDAAGRLVGVSAGGREVAYAYDGDGNLVERRAGGRVERFVYDVTGPVPVLLAAGPPGRPAAHHLLAPERLAVTDDQGRATWLLEDHLGSVRLTTDAAGRVTGTADYPAFGHAAPPAGAGGVGFAGEWADPDTGLVYLRARWYEPATGRFLSPDPVLGNPTDLVSLNRYAYAANDPVNAVDATGAFPTPPPPPPSLPRYDELARLARMGHAGRVFPAAAAPADPVRRPDFYVVSGDLNLRGVRLPRGVNVGGGAGVVLDRDFHPVGTISAGARLGFDFPFLKLGAYWLLQRSPATPAEVREFAAGFDLSARAKWVEGIRSGGRYAVGVTPTPGWSVGGSRTELLSDVRTGLDAIAHGLGAARTPAAGRAPNPAPVVRGPEPPPPTPVVPAPAPAARPGTGWLVPTAGVPGVSGPPGAPRVGGVYLKPLPALLKDLGPIRGLQYDAESGRLVLLGAGGEATTTTRLDAGDVAVVVRALAAGGEFAFSIDPVGDGTGPVMTCRYFGPIAGTRTGLVCFFQTDRKMKDFGLGQGADGKAILPKVDGMRDMFELGFERKVDTKGLWNRFWLSAGDKIEWTTAPDGKTLWCPSPAVMVRTEVMMMQGGKLVPAGGRTDPAAESFARFMTDNYGAIAEKHPEFESLRQLVGLVGLLTWAQRHVPPEEFQALAAALSPEPAATPVTTPAALVKRERPIAGGKQTLSIYGGTDARVTLPAVIPSSAALAGLTPAVRAALPAAPAPAAATVQAGNQTFRAVTVPLRRRAEGSLTRATTTLPAFPLTHHYNSTHTAVGPFGVGRMLLTPELQLRGDGELKSLHLSDAWGRFDRAITSAHYGNPTRTPDNTLALTARDGTTLEFNPNGRLLRYERAGEKWEYEYNGRRLMGVIETRGGKETGRLGLTYDANGLVTSARDHTGAEAAYRYEGRRLTGVRTGNREVGYEYDADGFLARVTEGGQSRSFAYTPDGLLRGGAPAVPVRPAPEPTPAPPAGVPAGVQLVPQKGNDRVRELIVGGEVVMRETRDAAGRPVVTEWPGVRREERTFRPDGTCASVVVEAGGTKATIKCDARGVPVEMTDPAGGVHQLTARADGWAVQSPAGTGRVEANGTSVRVTTAAGDEWYAEPGLIRATRAGVDTWWARNDRDEGHWRYREGEPGAPRDVATVRFDADGRVTEYQDVATGLSARAAYGTRGSTVRTPDGRQFVVTRDTGGRVTQVLEVPTGGANVAPPNGAPAK